MAYGLRNVNQHDHITFGLQMADIHTPVETLKPGEFTEMMAFISDTTVQFYYPHYMWIGIMFKYICPYCKSNPQKIIDCLQCVFFC